MCRLPPFANTSDTSIYAPGLRLTHLHIVRYYQAGFTGTYQLVKACLLWPGSEVSYK